MEIWKIGKMKEGVREVMTISYSDMHTKSESSVT